MQFTGTKTMNIGLMLLLSNNSYDNHGIHDNIVLPDITILKISLRYRLSWHFDIMINDDIVILPNSSTYKGLHLQYHDQDQEEVLSFPSSSLYVVHPL